MITFPIVYKIVVHNFQLQAFTQISYIWNKIRKFYLQALYPLYRDIICSKKCSISRIYKFSQALKIFEQQESLYVASVSYLIREPETPY